ncbi:glycosyltransferase family 4 protein [Luteimonas sp. A277]
MVSLFPILAETFIVREIQALIDSGVDVRILSLKTPRGQTIVHPEASALLDRVRQPQAPAVAFWNTLRAALSHPVGVIRDAAIIAAGTWRTPVAMIKSLVAMARGLEHLSWMRDFDPEFIHAHWSTYPSTAAWVLSRAAGRPFGFTCHAHDIFVDRHILARKIADSALAVTISRHNVDWIDRNVSPLTRHKLKVVHCGVDLAQLPWSGNGRDGAHILAIGRLVAQKGFGTLIDALALMHANGTGFRCTVVGDGPLRKDLQARIDRLGLGDRVEMAGALSQQAIRAKLQKATIFALPCEVAPDGNRDGIPVALMEAMAAGCPVVSCAVSGVPELITDEVHGLLAAEYDPAALARALERLLHDPGLRMRLSLAARQRIELEFDARKEALKLHRLMAEALCNAT